MAVAFRLPEVLEQRQAQRFRRPETERRRVADVQLDDLVALALELLGVPRNRTANLVADVGQVTRRLKMRQGGVVLRHAMALCVAARLRKQAGCSVVTVE